MLGRGARPRTCQSQTKEPWKPQTYQPNSELTDLGNTIFWGRWVKHCTFVFVSVWLLCFFYPFQEKDKWLQRKGGGEERWKEEKKRLLWLSGCSSTLWPYAAPGGLCIQATVSKRRGHLRPYPQGFSNGGVRENNAPIICWQVRSPGLTQPNSCWQLHRDSFQAVSAPGLGPSHQGSGKEHCHVCFLQGERQHI